MLTNSTLLESPNSLYLKSEITIMNKVKEKPQYSSRLNRNDQEIVRGSNHEVVLPFTNAKENIGQLI